MVVPGLLGRSAQEVAIRIIAIVAITQLIRLMRVAALTCVITHIWRML